MDSLTQITLGAAVGEVVLGKKIGNRAMVWGAIAGTIPDLDVLANFATDEMSATAFHRAITHSIPFAIVAPLALAYFVYRLYDDEKHPAKHWLLNLLYVFIFFLILNGIGVFALPIPIADVLPVSAVVSLSITGILAISLTYRRLRDRKGLHYHPSQREWYGLFFWSIFTHPLLDSCTAYGTQLFQPFSDLRVGLDNIAVVDPAYTLPFLLCIIIASMLTRRNRFRPIINWIGLGVSSAYLVFTFINKQHVHTVFEESLAEEQLSYSRLATNPTIFNNLLWQGIAESDSLYYHGTYSILDKKPKVPFFNHLPKNHHLLAPYADTREIKILKWFMNGYFNVVEREDGTLQINHLIYGSFRDKIAAPSDYVFGFILQEHNGRLELHANRSAPPKSEGNSANDFLERIKGI